MNTVYEWFTSARKPALRGGLALPRNKPSLNTDGGIPTLELPATICIPLLNYKQQVLDPVVCVGQIVRLGDPIAEGIIASCHGVIQSIETCAVPHPSALDSTCVIIAPDKDQPKKFTAHPTQEFVSAERISMCAVHGLGGAGFKTIDKLNAVSVNDKAVVDTLIINAVECEPLISCDESLIANQAYDIVISIEGLINLTQCRRCLFAIENDKTKAIEKLQLAIQHYSKDVRFELIYLDPIYPSGAERPLVERLTVEKMPSDAFPSTLGIVCINVATALATEQARQGIPMVSRVVSIAGDLAVNPIDVRVTFGTSVYDVILKSGNLDHIDNAVIRLGGPLSGYIIQDLSTPITATTNCITLESVVKPEQVHPCIRCGACSDVCPVELLPQQLNAYCLDENTDKAKAFRLNECIECACCDVVCPSNIPLTQTFRFAKGLIREQERQVTLATTAENRYEKRETRLADRIKKRELKRETAQARLETSKDPIADALARAKQRRRKKSE